MTSVVLADDDALMRAGLRMILEQSGDVDVLAEAADGAEAVRAARTVRPDVVLMDVRMPVMDGLEATGRITALPDPPRVVILTTFELDEYVFAALRAGASGFLLKRTSPEALVEAVHVVARGDALLAPSVTRRLIAAYCGRPEPEPDPRVAQLTDREREVLLLVARGLSNEELGRELHISSNTVKTHVKRLLAKLRVRDRVQAVVLAHESGLLEKRL